MRHYCTYFDSRYLVQGLTLYRSLSRHARPFVLWVLCFDDLAFRILAGLALPELKPVRLKELEDADGPLMKAKRNRSRVDYYFTCTPAWPLYLLDTQAGIDGVSYIDADLMFYASPEPIFGELGSRSILIVPHRFPAHLRHKEVYGVYNVGWLSFRNDERSRKCLQWWRERCLEWCYDRVEPGKFADQKYLDEWQVRFPGVAVLEHLGAGVAPWNWMNHRIDLLDGEATVDHQPLIFFHFQGLKILSRKFYDPGYYDYGPMPPRLRHWFYDNYIQAVHETAVWLSEIHSSHVDLGPAILTQRYHWYDLGLRLLQGRIKFSAK